MPAFTDNITAIYRRLSAMFEDRFTTVDDTLSETSENPVQNKVITDALDDKQDTLDYLSNQEINELFNSII